MTKTRTWYSRTDTARLLGVSLRQLNRWASKAAGSDGGALAGCTLFMPAMPASAWDSVVRYHRRQIELMIRALHEPERLQELEERWQTVCMDLGQYTIGLAEDLGLVKPHNQGDEHAA